VLKGRELLLLLKEDGDATDASGWKEEHHQSGGLFGDGQSVVSLVFALCSAVRKDAARFRSPRGVLWTQ